MRSLPQAPSLCIGLSGQSWRVLFAPTLPVCASGLVLNNSKVSLMGIWNKINFPSVPQVKVCCMYSADENMAMFWKQPHYVTTFHVAWLSSGNLFLSSGSVVVSLRSTLERKQLCSSSVVQNGAILLSLPIIPNTSSPQSLSSLASYFPFSFKFMPFPTSLSFHSPPSSPTYTQIYHGYCGLRCQGIFLSPCAGYKSRYSGLSWYLPTKRCFSRTSQPSGFRLHFPMGLIALPHKKPSSLSYNRWRYRS